MSTVTKTVNAELSSVSIGKDAEGKFVVNNVSMDVPNADSGMSGNLYSNNVKLSSATKTKLTAFLTALEAEI